MILNVQGHKKYARLGHIIKPIYESMKNLNAQQNNKNTNNYFEESELIYKDELRVL